MNLCFHVKSRINCNKQYMCISFGDYGSVSYVLIEYVWSCTEGQNFIFLSILVRSKLSSYASNFILKIYVARQCGGRGLLRCAFRCLP